MEAAHEQSHSIWLRLQLHGTWTEDYLLKKFWSKKRITVFNRGYYSSILSLRFRVGENMLIFESVIIVLQLEN